MGGTMLAGRLDVATKDFEIVEVPIPAPGPGEVLVKVAAAGVCLSDVHLIEGMLRPLYLKGEAVTLGHEVAGAVHALGPGVTAASPGDRVLLQAGERTPDGVVLTRGVDYDGGWAEYALAKVETLVPIPDSLPFEQACFIPDAVSTPWAAITRTGLTRPGEAAGVWGVGGLGAHAVQLLRMMGAHPIVAADPLPAARERAIEFGADLALDPADWKFSAKVREATGGRGLDVGFDFAGVAPVREQAAKVLAEEGRLVLVGLTDQPLTLTDGTRFSYLRQQVRGHYGSEADDVTKLVALVEGGRLDFARSVSGAYPLRDAAQAVRALEHKEGDPIRLVLLP
ncbi:zinc-binding dehydrogenase [Actinocorallia sp. A-T 12471]|uniref:zinc-binding dehydrogenase n=1 Tax=Actinocorallia sp. A-T 12471 TaxID=3089813 RepID=UPI0029CE9CBB|nr:zinc-binding dehydrogenase [Actinocorallia sp. A-T 12471]MDX6740378.1 zinc-binding dehydrogenase [Actinocorallia sp. A-T 12471]